MTTRIEEMEGKMIAVLEGELDTAAAVEVNEAFAPLHEYKGGLIEVDCNRLEYIASSGLRILLSMLKSAKANGNRVVLLGVNPDIKNVFKMTGFINLFEFE